MEVPLAIVLDGDVKTREAAAEAAKQAGAEVVVAATAREALDVVRAWAVETGPAEPLRPDDVPALTRTFVESIRRLNRLPPITVDPEALAVLQDHDWRGGSADLRQAIETAVIVANGGTVRVDDLPAFVRSGNGPGAARARADRRFREAKRSVVDAFERSYLSDLLQQHGGNVTAAAESAGMLRSALQRLLRKHELRSSSFRSASAVGSDAS
jgi:DNA-binding NtrC family response regulator